MPSESFADEGLMQRLPLPLAQLYRRAHNAKTVLERHNTAYFMWEAGLKLLGSVAIVEYAERPVHDPQLAERLTNLARPALGHWWEFVRRLLPVLADQGDADFAKAGELLLGKNRDDLPHAAGLDGALLKVLEGNQRFRTTVSLTELFDRLVHYRNQELGHGAIGRRSVEHYATMGNSLLAGVSEVLGRLNCLAGRRLLAVGDVYRQPAGDWLVERQELIGETVRRIESLVVPEAEATRLPKPGRVYAGQVFDPSLDEGTDWNSVLRSLHPLLIYDATQEELLFLNSRRGRKRTEYLGYTSGGVTDRPDLGDEQRAFLGQILGMTVADEQIDEWAAHSQLEEPASPPLPAAEGSRQLGEFELLSELGRGGMGVVFRAWQPSLGRQVALKKLQKSGDAKAEARFSREIHALGHVEHPHLVKIFTSGTEGDQWFYAMELIEGASLSEVCTKLESSTASVANLYLDTWRDAVSSTCEEARKAEKPLSSHLAPLSARAAGRGGTRQQPQGEEHELSRGSPSLPPALPANGARVFLAGRSYVRHIVTLMIQVAEAAHALHEQGIIHRDIKPGNLMVTSDGSHAVLMDLGLAKLADDVDGRLTRTRQFVGTLRYASPEQLAGARLDRRADVYSLGATLWELLALKPLFGITDHTPTPDAILKVQQAEPNRLRRHHSGLSRDLEAIVHKCLEKLPARRYATAHELGRDLGRFLEGKPVQARPVKGWERGWKWVKRRPALGALTAVIVLATAGLLGGGIWFTFELDQARIKAEEHARSEADLRVLADERAREIRDNAHRLERVARVERIRRVVAVCPKSQSFHVKVEVLKFASSNDFQGTVIPFASGTFFQDGEILAFRVTNADPSKNLYVSLLYLGGDYTIAPLYPDPQQPQNPLQPGQSIETRRLLAKGPWGLESLLVIAVPANGPPVDFTFVAQPSLERARATEARRKALDTPLGQVFQQVCFEGQGGAESAMLLDAHQYLLEMASVVTLDVSKVIGVEREILLEATALTAKDPKDRVRKESYCKTFNVKLKANVIYQIDMRSKEMDPFLRLEDAAGKVVANDDDSGGNLDARLVFACSVTGDYQVIATSFEPSATGSFTLRIIERGKQQK